MIKPHLVSIASNSIVSLSLLGSFPDRGECTPFRDIQFHSDTTSFPFSHLHSLLFVIPLLWPARLVLFFCQVPSFAWPGYGYRTCKEIYCFPDVSVGYLFILYIYWNILCGCIVHMCAVLIWQPQVFSPNWDIFERSGHNVFIPLIYTFFSLVPFTSLPDMRCFCKCNIYRK